MCQNMNDSVNALYNGLTKIYKKKKKNEIDGTNQQNYVYHSIRSNASLFQIVLFV